ncbi:thiamine-phosphate kinase [Gammaproteobacteria bacterium]|nr:thiamine-phosphate kinase [Gammaproteobacteria bacterium]MEC8314578.1 thiamine-phosphate kinase [Pseudomonadota bacterium]MEC8449131.1 thiamine-phosphate kinase [Pseudomonadota bacterium]MED5348718.1 thiamine-phosphate kinase [Pseudomonadota bacterium]
MDEHLLIQKYFSDIGSAYLAERNVEVSVGDDSSILNLNSDLQYVNSIDTSIEDIHFLNSMSPRDIAYRSCAVALSDLAACGANPSWYSIALTFPEVEDIWLENFSLGLKDFSDEYKIPLVGGDTTKGKLSVTVQVMGEVEKEKALLRSGAKENDLIYVSGIIGDAFLQLRELQKSQNQDTGFDAYLHPKAQIALGLELIDIANSAIDISDGLIQDLNLICKSSDVGAKVYLSMIPTSVEDKTLELINSGDDYQICFTASEINSTKIKHISERLGVPITEIGKITNSKELILLDYEGNKMELGSGYSHF